MSWAKTTLDDPTATFYGEFFGRFFSVFFGGMSILYDNKIRIFCELFEKNRRKTAFVTNDSLGCRLCDSLRVNRL